MRLILLGSGEFGLPTFHRLQDEHEVVAVVTQPDRPSGRGRKVNPTAIGAWASEMGLNLVKCDDVNDSQIVENLRAKRADAAVVIAFGQKLGQPLLDGIGSLALNLHASLLPKYRGAAPINWAIIHGERETGLSVISLAQRMDGGLIYGQCRTAIDPMQTAGELHDRLAALGPDLVADVLRQFEAGDLAGRPQDESQVTRAPKLSAADRQIDFDADPQAVRARVHGLTPWPGAVVCWHSAAQREAAARALKLLRVDIGPTPDRAAPPGTVVQCTAAALDVAVRDGVIRLLELQPADRRPMSAAAFLQGHDMAEGDRLTGR